MTESLLWHWYLIESHGGMMLTAKVEIVSRGVDFLLPLTWRRAHVDGRLEPVPKPRLPGNYAFVQLPSDPDDRELLDGQAAAVKGLRGVRELYKTASGRYAVVPAREIQALKNADAWEHREAGKAKPKFVEPMFKADARVRVVRGDFEGQVGMFLYAELGVASIAAPNGIRISALECDLELAPLSVRMAG